MREQERESSSTIQEPLKLSVCVGSSGPKRDLLFGQYDDIELTCMFADEEGISVTKMFNSFIHKPQFDLFVYLSEDYNFNKEDSLKKICDNLFSQDLNDVGAVFTDIDALVDGETTLLKSYPTPNKALATNKSVSMNIPFAVKSTIAPEFSDQFEIMFLHDGLFRLFQSTLVFHLPFSAFTLNNFTPSSKKMAKEMEIIKSA